jgi:hypothetical protein
MSTETNKAADLDKKAKLVDKCVAEKAKAQGRLWGGLRIWLSA